MGDGKYKMRSAIWCQKIKQCLKEDVDTSRDREVRLNETPQAKSGTI